MAEPANHELAKEIAVLRQTMETHKQEYKTDIARLAEQMARRDAESHKRDQASLRWTVGFGVAQIAVTIAVLAAGFAFLALVGIPAK